MPATVDTNTFRIEIANWRDFNSVRHLEQVCFPKDAWPIWDIVGVLTLPNVVRLKATVGEDIAGFIAGDIRIGQGLSWIATIGVLPEYRGKGIGVALLQACEALFPTPLVRLYVRSSNDPAIQMYRQMDYQLVGTISHYYIDGENALVFEKVLRNTQPERDAL